MQTEKKIYYSDLTNYVEVCYSCKSQNINVYNHYDDGRESSCNDCNSEDIGLVPQDEVL